MKQSETDQPVSNGGQDRGGRQGWMKRLRDRLQRKNRHLMTLQDVEVACKLGAHSNVGLQNVTLNQIRGSTSPGRTKDFDADFKMRRQHTQDRWRSVAEAYRSGKQLPPIKLIKAGNSYFVGDGHHRVSVSHALGREDINADVVEWEVTGDQPGQTCPLKNPNSP